MGHDHHNPLKEPGIFGKLLPWGLLIGCLEQVSSIYIIQSTIKDYDPATGLNVNDPRHWPLPQPPVNKIPKETVQGLDWFDTDYNQSIWLAGLMGLHPDPQIHEDLFSMITDSQIDLTTIKDQSGKLKINIVEGVPTLMFSEEFLSHVSTEEDILAAMSILTHQYQHYIQWTQGWGNLMPAPLEEDHPDPDAWQSAINRSCLENWNGESDALSTTCRLTNRWHLELYPHLCPYVDTPQWDHALFLELATATDYEQEMCSSVFAKKAGHPRPDSLAP